MACPRCGAPAAVSLASFDQRCPHCAAPLELPADVVAHVTASRALLERVSSDALRLDEVRAVLFGAERSRLVVVLVMLLFSCGGLEAFASAWGAIDKGVDAWRERIAPPLVGLAAAVAVAGLALWVQSRARAAIEQGFAARAPTPGAPNGACHTCGGPLAKASGAGAVRCGYCGADNLVDRASVIAHSAAAAGSLAEHADSLLRATRRYSLVTRGLGLALLVLLPVAVAVSHGVAFKVLEDPSAARAPRRR